MQSEQMPLSLLQNGLSLSQFFPSFLSIVSAFWEECRQFSAPCCLSLLPLGRPQHCYPLPCQQLPKRQYSRNFSLRGGGEGKICASLSPFPNVLVMLKSLLILPIMIKITIKLPPAYHEIFLTLMLSYRHFLQYPKPTPKNVLDECLSVLFN